MPAPLMLLNKDLVHQWRAERLKKDFSFTYIKGVVEGAVYDDGKPVGEMNVAIQCNQTGETLKLLWG